MGKAEASPSAYRAIAWLAIASSDEGGLPAVEAMKAIRSVSKNVSTKFRRAGGRTFAPPETLAAHASTPCRTQQTRRLRHENVRRIRIRHDVVVRGRVRQSSIGSHGWHQVTGQAEVDGRR